MMAPLLCPCCSVLPIVLSSVLVDHQLLCVCLTGLTFPVITLLMQCIRYFVLWCICFHDYTYFLHDVIFTDIVLDELTVVFAKTGCDILDQYCSVINMIFQS